MRPLAIGIDARELLGDTTGVGRYLAELLRRWMARPDVDARRFVLFTPEALRLSFGAHVTVRVVPGGRGTWWEQRALAAAAGREPLDVFFAPAYTAPAFGRVPVVATIHDVSFSRHPEWFRFREGTRRRWLTRRTAKRAARILTVSEFSRREIHELYGVPSDRITVVRNGISTPALPPETAREPLVLYTGSIFNRRNLPELLAAFARVALAVPTARLAIVGANRTWPALDLHHIARGLNVEGLVTIRDYVPDTELTSLYARASAFAFLSEYEGFGLTPLEAMAAGVPAVVLDTAVAREVYGDAVLYVPRGDVAATADALHRLLTSPADADALRSRAPGVLSRYSWDTAAEETLAAIEGAARR